MNLLIDIIGYIGAAIIGAVCLELFWYQRRRRKHARQELTWMDHTNSCPRCGLSYSRIPHKCTGCGYEFGPLGPGSKDNPPQQGEKEKK